MMGSWWVRIAKLVRVSGRYRFGPLGCKGLYSRVLAQHTQKAMESGKPVNACHRCGTTSYHPVFARAADGVMRPSGQYMCVKCKLLFTTITEWRLGEQQKPAAS